MLDGVVVALRFAVAGFEVGEHGEHGIGVEGVRRRAQRTGDIVEPTAGAGHVPIVAHGATGG